MKVICNNTQGLSREEWLALRKTGIGSSDAAGIAGLSKWATPLSIYLDKKGMIPEKEQSELMEWGVRLEPVIAAAFAEKTGLILSDKMQFVCHGEHDFILSNMDRWIMDPKILEYPEKYIFVNFEEFKSLIRGFVEIKAVHEYSGADWEDGIPDHYMLQIQHQYLTTGLKEGGHVAYLVGGNKFDFKPVPRDEEIIADLLKLELDFWHNYIEKGIAPAPIGSEVDGDVLKTLYPESDGSDKLLPDDAARWVEQREIAKAAQDEAKAQRDEAENNLKDLLKDAEAGTCGLNKVIWKTQASNRLDTTRLKAERPEIYETYLNKGTQRKFDIKPIKKK